MGTGRRLFPCGAGGEHHTCRRYNGYGRQRHADRTGQPAQTIQILENIKAALKQIGSGLEDVVRTRIYVLDINTWEVVGQIHGEYFDQIRPTTTMVEVSRLADPDMLVEIEAEAIIQA